MNQQIVVFGDSTTALREGLVVYADLIAAELLEERLDVSIVNAGVPGNDTCMAAERFETDVLAGHPDVVILQFGINDSSIDLWRVPPETGPRISKQTYRHNLLQFARQSQEQGATVIIMTPNQQRWSDILKHYYGKPPYDLNDPKSMTHLLGEYAEVAREVAAVCGAVLIDVYRAYDDFEVETGIDCGELLLDGSHPNQRGQNLVAALLMERLPGILKGRAEGSA